MKAFDSLKTLSALLESSRQNKESLDVSSLKQALLKDTKQLRDYENIRL